ncbi:hypothetical protein DFH08DRAFT_818763 [Mycena albidolilacea]|uniref:Uncharacterized protein n=1 Tax=Mycena albidolilacea TaxID=1033008 RepID=A0AAD6ZFT3_9AGAR|nr:hypothetical protein DFH08DRAFT_818763 [Mycena albidolilacea]
MATFTEEALDLAPSMERGYALSPMTELEHNYLSHSEIEASFFERATSISSKHNVESMDILDRGVSLCTKVNEEAQVHAEVVGNLGALETKVDKETRRDKPGYEQQEGYTGGGCRGTIWCALHGAGGGQGRVEGLGMRKNVGMWFGPSMVEGVLIFRIFSGFPLSILFRSFGSDLSNSVRMRLVLRLASI